MKNILKELIVLVVILIILINLFVPSISLALETGKAEFSLVTSAKELKRGDTFTARLNFNPNGVKNIYDFCPSIFYNASVLQVESLTQIIDEGETYELSYNNNIGSIAFHYMKSLYPPAEIIYSGDLFEINFKVREDADLGNTLVSIAENSAGILDKEMNELPYTVVNWEGEIVKDPNAGTPGKLSLDITHTELWNGDRKKIETIPANTPVEWKSSDESVATVSQNGYITAIARGTAIITATDRNGNTATCTVNVKQLMGNIIINKTSITLKVGETEQLSYTLDPPVVDVDTSSHWYSDDESIATVDENGVVTAKKEGTTTIQLYVGGYGRECRVTVTDESFLRGDINNDGEITAADLNYGLRKLGLGGITEDEIQRGDVTGDGEYTAADLNRLLRYVGGILKEL